MNKLILMADIIDSRKYDSQELITNFKELVTELNTTFKRSVLSPLTITLGDEFQGVVVNYQVAIQLMIFSEEYLIRNKKKFKMRYVLYEGRIDTKINTEKAYEMLGEGLIKAREELIANKKNGERFHIVLKNTERSNYFNKTFCLFQFFIDNWKIKDSETVTGFLDGLNYRDLADKMGKNKSTLWRREKSLSMKEYRLTKQLLLENYAQ